MPHVKEGQHFFDLTTFQCCLHRGGAALFYITALKCCFHLGGGRGDSFSAGGFLIWDITAFSSTAKYLLDFIFTSPHVLGKKI